MKLALIRRHFAATGGAELYTQRLVGALAEAGHEVHLITEHWEGQASGVKIRQAQASGSRAERPARFAEAAAQIVTGEAFDCVFSLERTWKQDVYRAGDGLHRVWLQQRRRYAPWWKRPWIGRGAFHRQMLALEARTFDPQNTGCVIVNSEMVRKEILQHFAFPAERIHLVRNGVNVARFQGGDRAGTRARFGLKEDDFVLLFVGSGWERKGLPFLLKLMRRWAAEPPPWAEGRAIKLLVVGKGRLRGKVPSNVILAGPMAQVEDAYAAADLLTFLPIYEPSSNVVAEALAAGIPVVTSAFNGASELLDAQNGTVLADPADAEGLAEAVRHWMKREDRSPVRAATPLDLETNVEATLTILKEAADRRLRP